LEKKNITNLVICGMMSHMCIDTSVRTAKKLRYDITLISDACTVNCTLQNSHSILVSLVSYFKIYTLFGISFDFLFTV
ncbi:isochorismatase family protein, partial [Clostridioides difficile]